jgi:hypothetical protein
MISWNENYPIVIESMTHWLPVFKNENWEVIWNRKSYINSKIGTWIGNLLMNLGIVNNEKIQK